MRDDHRLKRATTWLVEELRAEKPGFPLRMARAGAIWQTETDGWCIPLAYLPRKGAHLEIWFDRYSGHHDRTFWAGFFHPDEKVIRALVNKVRNDWPLVLELRDDDVVGSRITRMKTPLPISKFGDAVVEYYRGANYFGIYHRPKSSADGIETRFCRGAAFFFQSVIARLKGTEASALDMEVYSRLEPARVRSHLVRERNRDLAERCKVLADYRCYVCEMTFEEVYGPLGKGFAEAHHRQALASLDPAIPTKPEDLVTVCANCHRMLHRMDGEKGDLQKLSSMVRKRRQ
jgi:hypothetical protein